MIKWIKKNGHTAAAWIVGAAIADVARHYWGDVGVMIVGLISMAILLLYAAIIIRRARRDDLWVDEQAKLRDDLNEARQLLEDDGTIKHIATRLQIPREALVRDDLPNPCDLLSKPEGGQLKPLECIKCGEATGPLHPLDSDHAGWLCPKCYWGERNRPAGAEIHPSESP